MKKSIQKPENWQDFESLCKKLWGEIWQIPNKIKKNGRSGQSQKGVDLYGKPKEENYYCGIQCKLKDIHTNGKLTIAEIEKEIELAKEFTPQLGEFIIATTANKDVKIEEYIREQNLKSINNGGFGIDLYCWEDIEYLLEDYPNILNWYLSGLSSRTEYDITTVFDPKILKPNFIQEITKFKEKETIPEHLKPLFEKINRLNKITNIQYNLPKPNTHINHSFTQMGIQIINTGTKVIEHSKVIINFTKGIREIYGRDNLYIIIHLETPLVQKSLDIVNVDILIEHNISEIEFELELIAADFNIKKTYSIPVEQVLSEKIKYVEITKDEQNTDDLIEIKDNIESYYNGMLGIHSY